jgi:hypothetical protein
MTGSKVTLFAPTSCVELEAMTDVFTSEVEFEL